jgi:N-acyl-L-homoserine lactone synthetase
MHYITFDFLSQHRHGTTFRQYLHLRKRFFVDVLGWDIPHNDEVEMDQYDNPCAHYVLALRGEAVVGGARLMPTTATWGRHRYMLRDAFRGELSIPRGVVIEEIVTPKVWECTRLVVSDEIRTHKQRSSCLSLLLAGAADLVRAHGGTELISLSPVLLARALCKLGFPVERAGDPYLETDGRTYAMLRMPLLPLAHSIAAE